MKLPITPPLEPMLAKRVDVIPRGEEWLFEPKWDGFRALVFRDGAELFLQSRDKKSLNRYFPELEAPLLAALPPRCAVDGEIVIARDGALDFEALQLRIHPAESRVNMLASELPASIVIWDLLCIDDEALLKAPFSARRARLEELLENVSPPIHLTPITRDRAVAADWFSRFEGAGFDGVMAKSESGLYEPKKRSMLKVKHQRTVDCVVAGYRWHKNSDAGASGGGDMVGSLLLGLYDDRGVLHHIGVAASFSDAKRRELVETLAPYRTDGGDHPWKDWQIDDQSQRRPGSTSRWARGKNQGFVFLRPELVVEVSYDHMQGTRLRHTAHFKRWRPDKPPEQCSYDQVDVVPPVELRTIFG